MSQTKLQIANCKLRQLSVWTASAISLLFNPVLSSKARHLAFISAVLCLFILGACTRPAAPPLPSRVAVAPTPSASDPTNTLLVIGSFTGDSETQFRDLLAQFGQNNGITAEYQGAGEVAELLRQLVEEGRTPDIILLPKVNWLYELASAGAIVPLSPDVAAQVRENFGEALQDEVTYESALYGVPFDANLKSLLWYRPSALDTVPITLNGLTDIAESRADDGQATFTVPGGAGWPLTDWFENILLATAGVEVYDGLISHSIAWTDTRVIDAAEAYVTLLQPEYTLDGLEGATTLPLDETAFARSFTDEESLFWLGQGTTVNQYATRQGLTAEQDYDVVVFPTNGTLIIIGSIAVATNDNPTTTAFLNFLTQPDSITPRVAQGEFVAANSAVALDTYPSAVARREAELLADASALRPDLSDQLPPNLGASYLGDQLREMLKRPDEIDTILAEIERIATREQGRVLPPQ